MEDILLKKVFTENDRWEYAINKGEEKGIKKKELIELCTPEKRAEMYLQIKHGLYEIAPSHEAQVPKDDGTMRTVYANEGIDRVFLSIVNDLLFEMCKDMVHPRCTSYQKGLSCQKTVRELSKVIGSTPGYAGYKADLSKFFDSVPIEYIDETFDKVEERVGKSKIIDVLRKYYHSNTYFDLDGNLQEKFRSLQQGCAVAAFLADAVLYDVDKEISEMDTYYVRYSDDIMIVGGESDRAMDRLADMLEERSQKLNPNKVEIVSCDRWVKFLGYSIRGNEITISKGRLDTFEHEIIAATIGQNGISYEKALHNFYKYFYIGDGEHSPAQQILSICNSESDVLRMDNFVKDCLRAVITGKKKLYGLGYKKEGNGEDGVIPFTPGPNVAENRKKVPVLVGYKPMQLMRNALISDHAAYDTLVRCLI